MSIFYPIGAICLFVCVIGVTGYVWARHLDRKYGVERKRC